MEHYRPKIGSKREGYYRGYYCGRCGSPGLSMMGRCTKHSKNWDSSGVCLSRPTIVDMLNEANTPEAEAKREFVSGLKKGKAAQRKNRQEWERTI